ncbi:alpha/beta fold hydrolase [Prauserella rugosa]|uniref:Pimeloyl-ACP methyl ester carboxylesterase n=1 Tax=Prauserella rugosa TaxID=43354 RepID=A0A660C9I4_9PSEU|nr:alpha/beta hydrolase [Prauserella rugosa]KMS90421.1 alpha/beta hydrolase [Streptomyces regensis]TWH20270.1 pimeloyl-ACP methyl ester carboxylesterase [Prauserella rugosa]
MTSTTQSLLTDSVHVNGVDIAYVDKGEGDPVVLLHGFPDSHYLWRHQIDPLVEAGHRVIVPDQRGFGESSKPQDVESYDMRTLVNDIVGLTQHLGISRAHLVGHDWGAAIAWMYAFLMPRRVDHLAVFSVGHPGVFATPTIEQRKASWYMLFYQFPGVSEELLRRNGWRLFKEIIGSDGDHRRYPRELAKPGALTAALNWYRANRSPESELRVERNFPPVLAPTLGVWSTGDQALLEEGMTGSQKFVKGPWRYERVEDAGHWIPLDQPALTTDLLRGFLGSMRSAAAPSRRRRL